MTLSNVARGRELSRGLIAETVETARALAGRLGRRPVLAIVAGDDADARRFVQLKRDALASVAISIDAVWLDEDAATEAAVAAIEKLNARDDVDAIFLQFPLPPGVDAVSAANAVVPAKDIDCSSEGAEAQFAAGRSRYTPVAPQAALDLLHNGLGVLTGKRIVLAAGDDPFMRALDVLLRGERADVQRLAAVARDGSPWSADALVVGDSLPGADMLDSLGHMNVLLDAGYYLPPRPADWIPPDVRERIDVHLTQYGNVGPLTIAHLARSTLGAAAATGLA